MDWPALIEHRLSATTPSERKRARHALNHLRGVFGEQFHLLPEILLRNLWNTAPWTYQWIYSLSDSIVRVSESEGYQALLKDLTDPEKFTAAYSALDVGERLIATGLDVAFEVPLRIGGVLKKPDLRVTDQHSGVEFFIEVSTLYLSQSRVEASAALDRITPSLMGTPPHVWVSGRLMTELSSEEASAIAARLRCCIREAGETLAYRELCFPGLVEAVIGHEAHSAALAFWCARRGLELGAFASPPAIVDLSLRFERKVAREGKQLPPGASNLLVLDAPELLFGVDDPRVLLPLIDQALSQQPHIAAIAIANEESTHATPSAISLDERSHFLTSYRSGTSRHVLLAFSNSCTIPVPAPTQVKLREAFAL